MRLTDIALYAYEFIMYHYYGVLIRLACWWYGFDRDEIYKEAERRQRLKDLRG